MILSNYNIFFNINNPIEKIFDFYISILFILLFLFSISFYNSGDLKYNYLILFQSSDINFKLFDDIR